MKIKDILSNKYLTALSNRYVLTLVIFGIWMLFFDENSFINHYKTNKEIEKLEIKKKHYSDGLARDTVEAKKLSTKKGLEKFARERYHMKKENEDIYIIKFDSTNKK